MVKRSRTSSFPSKNLAVAIAWAREVATYVTSKTGAEAKLDLAMCGNPYRIPWVGQTENLGAHEQAWNKAMGDPKYLESLSKAADVFLAGSSVDEFWQSI